MSAGLSKNQNIASWVVRVIAAVIFLFPVGAIPKLMGDPYAVELFNQLGAGDAGRYGVASMELLAAILLIVPKTVVYGGILGVFIMLGAIASHLFKLGVVVHFTTVPGASPENPEANPMLFGLAIVNLIMCSATVFLNRGALPFGKSSGAAASNREMT